MGSAERAHLFSSRFVLYASVKPYKAQWLLYVPLGLTFKNQPTQRNGMFFVSQYKIAVTSPQSSLIGFF